MHASSRRPIRGLAPIAAAALVLALAASILIAASPGADGVAAAGSVVRAPATVTGDQIVRTPSTLKAGTVVGAARLMTPRVFLNAKRGFALATVKGVTYPAVTQNGGLTWRTNGPALHLPAAQAPLVVTSAGAAKKKTFFAFGGGQAVDSTIDGGAHWYRALLGDVVLACVASGDHLIAFAQVTATGNTVQTLVYVSTDGGREWHLNQTLGAP
jgi:hypothetical protein